MNKTFYNIAHMIMFAFVLASVIAFPVYGVLRYQMGLFNEFWLVMFLGVGLSSAISIYHILKLEK